MSAEPIPLSSSLAPALRKPTACARGRVGYSETEMIWMGNYVNRLYEWAVISSDASLGKDRDSMWRMCMGLRGSGCAVLAGDRATGPEPAH